MARGVTQAANGMEVRTNIKFGHNKINLRSIAALQADWFTTRTPAVGTADPRFLPTQPRQTSSHILEPAPSTLYSIPSRRIAHVGRSFRFTFAILIRT